MLSLIHTLDYETTSAYNLVVAACDKGVPPLCTNMTVCVDVEDSNDNTPTFAKSHYQVNVPEQRPIGTVVLEAVATDSDGGVNGIVDYRVLSSNTTLFALDSSSGNISVNGE